MAEYRSDSDIALSAVVLATAMKDLLPNDTMSVLAATLAAYAERKSERTGRPLSEVLAEIETFMEKHAGYLRQLSEKTKQERK